ncbi:MAG: hypothetical protein ACJAS4_000724 [Bacteriovoracaceae bacterium]|jgi:hypothetical protein
MSSFKLSLDIYGIHIEIKSDQEKINNILKKDFAYFIKNNEFKSEKKLIINIIKKETGVLPVNLIATKQTTNSIYYDVGKIRYNDYFGKAVTVFNYEKESVDVFYVDEGFLHEITYLLILSRSAKFMDSKGFHKIHACSVKLNEKNIVFMMGSKGGKSTLFMELIRDTDTKIISDDTPVVDRKGRIYPFPLRIGIEDKNKLYSYFPYLREADVYEFERQNFNKKYLVSIEQLENKVSTGDCNILIQGFRTTLDKPRLEKITKFKMFKYLLGHMVIGIGLPLILEYFIEHTTRDHFRNIKNLLSRLISAYFLLLKSECYEFYMTENVVANGVYLKKELNER